MTRLRVALTTLTLCLYTLVPQTASFAALPVETDSAMSYLEVLADPERFEGRKTGMETGSSSQEWIAERFAQWGLKPLIDGNLLHRFPMLATEPRKARFTLLDTERYGDLDFLPGDDFNLTTNSGSGRLTAPVVLVGHGISKPDKGWDDYGDVDVAGKAVVIIRGKPPTDEQWDDEYKRTYLINEAAERGAAAVLFYMGEDVIGGAAIMEDGYHPDLPSLIIGERVMAHLLYGTGFTFDIYTRVLKNGPRVLEIDKQVRIEAKLKRIEDAYGYNVAGVVPGTDPALAGEAVLFGGHGDHVGVNSMGHVYPGADDNASGTVVVMELARVFAQTPQPRTMIFMVFGGEEQGLLGSRALVPELPDEYEYIAMVNLDMAGRGEGVTGIGGGNAIPELWYDFYSSLSDSMRGQIKQRRPWGGFSSDHAHFREAGIPAFTTYSSGSHDHYHTTEDTYKTIDTRAINGCLSAIGQWLQALASHPEPLAYDHQPEAVVWHRGYGFRDAQAGSDGATDLANAEAAMREGFGATVLTLSAPAGKQNVTQFERTLDSYRDVLAARDNLSLGDELKQVRGDAYNLRGTVFLAVQGDSLTSADSLRMEFWDALGLHWVRLQEPTSWLANGDLRFDKEGVVHTWKRLDTIIELPLASASEWSDLLDDLGPVVFTGDWEAFSALDDTTLDDLHNAGAHFIVRVADENLPDALAASERIHAYKIHLQPSSTEYSDALSWVRTALKTAGVEKEQLLEWIGDNYGTW